MINERLFINLMTYCYASSDVIGVFFYLISINIICYVHMRIPFVLLGFIYLIFRFKLPLNIVLLPNFNILTCYLPFGVLFFFLISLIL